MRKFKFAGISKVDGRYALRASNRDVYAEILERNKNTNVKIFKLDKPMTKDQAREFLARKKEFKSPQILAVLRRGEEPKRKAKAVKKKAVKKAVEQHNDIAA
jgi:hypothetical protein